VYFYTAACILVSIEFVKILAPAPYERAM
jgi:hypothetical protein